MALLGSVIKEAVLDQIVRTLKPGTELDNGCIIEKISKLGQLNVKVKVKTPSDSDRRFIIRMAEEL